MLSRVVKDLCLEKGATFIVNDFVNVAKAVDADGIHLGLNDDAVHLAREILGFEKIIGGTANTFTDIQKRIEEKCDYVGVGPFRFTKTKSTLSPILGVKGYNLIMQELEKLHTKIPVFAIGGIETEDIEEILNTGIYGVAVSGLITNSMDQKQTVEQLKNLIYVTS
jgi:thiamine-phosphate pyrophosphorylase